MKKILTAAALGFAITVSGAMAADGEALFKSAGCTSCHKPNTETVGPSLKKIAQAYKGKEGELFKFMKGEAKPIVDPAKFGIMKPFVEKTKKMSDDEVKAIADYILKH